MKCKDENHKKKEVRTMGPFLAGLATSVVVLSVLDS